MRPLRTSWRPTQILIAAAMILSALMVVEAWASHITPMVGDPATPWTVHIRQVDEALAQGNVSAARRACHEAYVAALGSRSWQGLLEVGDAYLRIGDVAGLRKEAESRARRVYLTALFRARHQGSLDGVLRATEAFGALGDQEVAEQGIRIAQSLAARTRDEQARDRVREVRERLTARALTAPGREFDPF